MNTLGSLAKLVRKNLVQNTPCDEYIGDSLLLSLFVTRNVFFGKLVLMLVLNTPRNSFPGDSSQERRDSPVYSLQGGHWVVILPIFISIKQF
jgi:hypothetical protein